MTVSGEWKISVRAGIQEKDTDSLSVNKTANADRIV